MRAAPAFQNGRDPIPSRAGVGLRFRHHGEIVELRPDIAWLEVHTENYLGGGHTPRILDAIRHDYPISLHGVGLSLGSAEGLDPAHLRRVCDAVQRFQPALVSEHLSWSVVNNTYLADLLPLPMTEEALAVVCGNVDVLQDALRRRILVENPSSYLQYRHSTMAEWDFIAEVARRTGCGILCDVNNVYVGAKNHGWDASRYLAALPREAVGEIHLAGHAVRVLDNGHELLIDDHGSRVCEDVWQLYGDALARFGAVPTLIEWDTDVPPLETLMQEANRAGTMVERTEAAHAHARAA